jgi:hypothetical protein
LLTDEISLEQFVKAGVTIDENKGMLVGTPLAVGEGIGAVVLPQNVVMTLVPAAQPPLYTIGSQAPGGPFSDEFDPNLQATRFGGWGIFVNIEPGDYAVRFERGGQRCSQTLPGYGYGADRDGNMRVKVVAGYTTVNVAAFCP